MKKIGSLMISVTALVALFALVGTGAKAQSLNSTHFVGKFTLPFEAQWGRMALPPGNYNLKYGFTRGGLRMVEVAGEDKADVHGWVIAWGSGDTKGEGSFLVCVLEGGKGYVRSLQMAGLGDGIEFARPHGVSVAAWIVAGIRTNDTNTRVSEVRIPVAPVK